MFLISELYKDIFVENDNLPFGMRTINKKENYKKLN